MPRAVAAQTLKKFIRDGQKVDDWGTISIVDALADATPRKPTSNTSPSSRAARPVRPGTALGAAAASGRFGEIVAPLD